MDGDVGGDRILVTRNGRAVESFLRGPVNTLRVDRPEMRLPFRVVSDGNGAAKMRLDGQEIHLPLNKYSEWVRFAFHPAPGIKVRGICQFLLKSFEPPFDLYCTPLHIDPHKPVMPISIRPVMRPTWRPSTGRSPRWVWRRTRGRFRRRC